MKEQEGPVEEKMRGIMNDIGHLIGDAIHNVDPNYGFALLVFECGERVDSRMNYISNAHREDMLAAMKEFIARNEGRYGEYGVGLRIE